MEFIFIALSIIIILIMMVVHDIREPIKIKKQLLNEYGGKPDHFSHFNTSYYESLPHNHLKEIDKQTWRDLNMSEMLNKINYTQSSIGEANLYKMLHQLETKETLNKREKLIQYFMDNEKQRISTQFLLFEIGKVEDSHPENLQPLLMNCQLKFKKVFSLFAYLPIISLFSIILHQEIGIVLFFLTTSINVLLHYFAYSYLKDLEYPLMVGGMMIRQGNKMIATMDPNHEYTKRLIELNSILFPALKHFKGSLKSEIKDFTAMFLVVKFFILTQPRNYFKVRDFLIKHEKEYLELYELLGDIDCMIAIGAYRHHIEHYCLPSFDSKKEINTVDLSHPLLSQPISNSIQMTDNIMLTGSNASGKSTFIKALGLSAILAQTIHTVRATSFKLYPFLVVSSMAIQDNIVDGESYFIAEIKSLKRMFDLVNQTPCFCLIDEILRGTNTIERIKASQVLLNDLKTKPALCMIATHDIELTSLVSFEQYHFSETIIDHNIEFDYTLKEGICKTRNALKLLEIYGFDKDLIKRANEA